MAVDWRRWFRHLFATRRELAARTSRRRRSQAIEQAIAASEAHARRRDPLRDRGARSSRAKSGAARRRGERALEVFATLGVWDTEANNGVLIYVLLADRDVEIVADRGLNGRVSAEEWRSVCETMEQSVPRRAL